jgi:hypothetical protein
MLKLGSFVVDLSEHDRLQTNLYGLRKNVEMVTKLYVTMPLVIVGFICNILIVVVLGRDKTMNETIGFLLQMLALADIFFYVLCQLMNISEVFSDRKSVSFLLVYQKAVSRLQLMAVIVTYQRYVAVSRPLHARQYITTSRARVAVVVVWIGSFIIYLPFKSAYYHMFVPNYLYFIIFISTVY